MSAPTFEEHVAAFHRTGMVCWPAVYCVSVDSRGPCGCAIGAALFDRLGLAEYDARMKSLGTSSIGLFAETFQADLAYAHGVNDGFSNPSEDTRDIWTQFPPGDPYARGLVMGERVRAAVMADDTIPKYEADEADEEDEE